VSPIAEPVLCYVTNRGSLPALGEGLGKEDALLGVIERAVAAGVDWIQIREKDLAAARLVALTREALRASAGKPARPTRILVNDRLDVALAAGAGGVHLGEESLPVEEVRRWLPFAAGESRVGADFLVGVSCHSLESAQTAERAGASYIFFGPVFATPSKAVYGVPQGTERLAEICHTVKIPVLAIGGITFENVRECLSAGAEGIAAIRLFQGAGDLAAVVARFREVSARP
jgi:thiamine-phosphate pyrophosphorylase